MKIKKMILKGLDFFIIDVLLNDKVMINLAAFAIFWGIILGIGYIVNTTKVTHQGTEIHQIDKQED